MLEIVSNAENKRLAMFWYNWQGAIKIFIFEKGQEIYNSCTN